MGRLAFISAGLGLLVVLNVWDGCFVEEAFPNPKSMSFIKDVPATPGERRQGEASVPSSSDKLCWAPPEDSPAFNEGLVLNHRYMVERVLGSGNQGFALLCRDLIAKHQVVVKFHRTGSADAFREFIGLGVIHRVGKVPEIISINDIFLHNGLLGTVSPLQGMKLYLREQGVPGSAYSVQSCLYFIREALYQLDIAHARNVLHGDVGVTNILVDADLPGEQLAAYLNRYTRAPQEPGLARPKVHVIDWGWARGVNVPNQTDARVRPWKKDRDAPEILLAVSATPKSDVWRAGYVLAAFLAGRRPTIPPEAKPSFEAGTKLPIDGILDLTEYYGGCVPGSFLERVSDDELQSFIQQRRARCLSRHASPAENIRLYLETKLTSTMSAGVISVLADLLQGMLAADPDKRFSVRQVIGHPAMRLIDHVP